MAKKVVLAGGTGFIGEYLNRQFSGLGYKVVIISRREGHLSWKNETKIKEALEGAELLVNLAGKSVNCRYNEKNRQEIMDSRTKTTDILGTAILLCEKPPALWINSSTATIYRHAEDRPMTEEDGEIGSGFSVDVAKAWENAFFSFDLPHTRQAALRIAIVLGQGGGVMTPYTNLVRFGLGGVQGSGQQRFSWIHIEDLFRIILFLKDHEQLSGVFNCSAPYPVKNREFMTHMRKLQGRKIGLPASKWMLEIGSLFLRTETELVLKSRWVIPERLEKEGFRFKYRTVDEALAQIVNETALSMRL